MWNSKKKIKSLIFFLPLFSLGICSVAWSFSQEIEDYHLERDGSIYRVSTELETAATEEGIQVCFSAPDGTDACFPFCDVDGETVACTVRHPLFAPVYRNGQFRFRHDLDNRPADYSPYMTVEELQSQIGLTPEQLERITLLYPGGLNGGEGGGSGGGCADGEIWNDITETCDPEIVDGGGGGEGGGGDEILCAEACEVGYFCNPANGLCEVAPDENVCEDVVCDPGQVCDRSTGACVGEGEDSEGGGGNRSPGTNRRSNDDNDPPAPVNPLACAYNPASCGDTKGWCSLNPEAGFNPFVFVWVLLSVFLVSLRGRRPKQSPEVTIGLLRRPSASSQ